MTQLPTDRRHALRYLWVLVLVAALVAASGCATTQEICQTRFENAGALDLARDNLNPTGWLLDPESRPQQDLQPVISFGTDLYPVTLEELTTCPDGKLYTFYQDRTALPLKLRPNGQVNQVDLAFQGSPQTALASTIFVMDPQVLVLPVYTWRFIGDVHGESVDADEVAMQYAFDKASITLLSTDLRETYWAQARVDELWSQCGIQFRLAQHRDVIVPECWNLNVDYNRGFSCWRGCWGANEAELADCLDPCNVYDFIMRYDYYVPAAINLYLVRSLAVVAGDVLGGARCRDLVYLNDAQRSYGPRRRSTGRTIAHEIGHILLDSSDHEDGTLMGVEYLNGESDLLTEDQCTRARTANPRILASRLTGG